MLEENSKMQEFLNFWRKRLWKCFCLWFCADLKVIFRSYSGCQFTLSLFLDFRPITTNLSACGWLLMPHNLPWTRDQRRMAITKNCPDKKTTAFELLSECYIELCGRIKGSKAPKTLPYTNICLSLNKGNI